MIDLTPKAYAILRRQHGHVSVRQLIAAGVTRNGRQRLVDGHALVEVHRGVLRVSSAPITFEGHCVALCLAHPAGFITGPPAGRLMSLRRMPSTAAMILCVPHGIHLQDAGVIFRQSRNITHLDFDRLRSGIVVASGSRLAFDLATDLSAIDHASVVEQLIQRKKCTMASLGATARRLCHPSRPGSALFARTLLDRGDRPASRVAPRSGAGRRVASSRRTRRATVRRPSTTWRCRCAARPGCSRGALGHRDRRPPGSSSARRNDQGQAA